MILLGSLSEVNQVYMLELKRKGDNINQSIDNINSHLGSVHIKTTNKKPHKLEIRLPNLDSTNCQGKEGRSVCMKC